MAPAMTTTVLLAGRYGPVHDVTIEVFEIDDPLRPRRISGHAGVENASFLEFHPVLPVVYAVSETTQFDGRPGGGVVSLLLDPEHGALREMNRVSSLGDGPCHVAIDDEGRRLFVANYLSGSVAAYELHADGSIGAPVGSAQHRGAGPTARQTGPHAHCVRVLSTPQVLYAVDLGADEVICYDAGEQLVSTSVWAATPGAGPRHLAVHPNRPIAALVNELDNSLVTFDIAPTGELAAAATLSTLPCDANVVSLAADVRFDRSGSHIYVSNRGHDSVALYSCGGSAADVDLVAHVPTGGRSPRCLVLLPSGQVMYVANQDSDVLTVLAIDPGTGRPGDALPFHTMAAPAVVATREVEW